MLVPLVTHGTQIIPHITEIDTLLHMGAIPSVIFYILIAVGASKRWDLGTIQNRRRSLCIVQQCVMRGI